MNDALKLVRKFQTRNPFEIARSLGIRIIFEDLGDIRGYYNKIFRQKQIHINQNLEGTELLFTCAHELGHAVKHPESNTPFLRKNTYFSINRFEIEANRFAMFLLISDDDLRENKDFTIEQLSRLWGYTEELIKLRIKPSKTIL